MQRWGRIGRALREPSRSNLMDEPLSSQGCKLRAALPPSGGSSGDITRELWNTHDL